MWFSFKYKIRDFLHSISLMYKWNKHLIRENSFRDDDYSFVLVNERFHLQLLLEDFQKCKYVDMAESIRDIKLAISLLDIILESWKEDHEPFVNTHNAYRFSGYLNERIHSYDMYEQDICGDTRFGKVVRRNLNILDSLKRELREEKALALYNKLRTYKLFSWSY